MDDVLLDILLKMSFGLAGFAGEDFGKEVEVAVAAAAAAAAAAAVPLMDMPFELVAVVVPDKPLMTRGDARFWFLLSASRSSGLLFRFSPVTGVGPVSL